MGIQDLKEIKDRKVTSVLDLPVIKDRKEYKVQMVILV
jgi:hypothetical protein